MSTKIEGAAFILWLDYHTEGWQPVPFDSESALIDYIQNGVHNPFVITSGAKRLRMTTVSVPTLPCPVCDDGIEETCPRCGSASTGEGSK